MKTIVKYLHCSDIVGLVIFLTMIAGVGTAQSQTGQPIVFPARGQTQEQTEKDKADCNAWAKQQSGYDPLSAGLQTPQAPYNPQVTQQPAPAPPPQGGVVRGGARGAAGGAAIGAIAGNAGKGAAIGAATGGAVGGIRQRRNAQSQAAAQQQAYQEEAASNQQASQQEAADQQKIDAYNRAFSACMEGKGYTVK